MRAATFITGFTIVVGAAQAQSLSRPAYLPTDSWTYVLKTQANGQIRQSLLTISFQRIGADQLLANQIDDANPDRIVSRMYGPDWSFRRSINGRDTLIGQPLSFPLEVGKSWTVKYEETNPTPQKLREVDTIPYKAVGWEDISVPAGKFHALKIESNGTWTAYLAPHVLNNAVATKQGNTTAISSENRVTQSIRVTGNYYYAYWYVPEIKRWVKSVEESYSSGGTLSTATTAELSSYMVNEKGLQSKDVAPLAPQSVTPPAATAKSTSVAPVDHRTN